MTVSRQFLNWGAGGEWGRLEVNAYVRSGGVGDLEISKTYVNLRSRGKGVNKCYNRVYILNGWPLWRTRLVLTEQN